MISQSANNGLLKIVDTFNILNQKGKLSGDRVDIDILVKRAKELGGNNLALTFSNLAKQGENARISITDCYEAILNGNTKGVKNVKNIIETFNNLDPKNQKDFATAVSATNNQLGSYLMNLDGAKANSVKYTGQLMLSTAKTVGLTIATAALNTALSMGLSAILSGLVWVWNEVVHAEEKAIEAHKETAESAKEEIDTLKELYNTYFNVSQGLKEGTKTKDDLTNATNSLNYELGLESEKLDVLIDKYGDYKKAIKAAIAEKLREKLPSIEGESKDVKNSLASKSNKYGLTFKFGGTEIDLDRDRAQIWLSNWFANNGYKFSSKSRGVGAGKNYFLNNPYDKATETSEAVLYEIEFLNKIIKEFQTNPETKKLSYLEGTIEAATSRRDTLQKAYDEYYKKIKEQDNILIDAVIFETEIEKDIPKKYDEYLSYRNDIFDKIKNDDNAIGTADELESVFSNNLLSNNSYKIFEVRYQNIENLTDRYIKSISDKGKKINSTQEKQISNFLNSLSDEELEIAREIPNLFENGLKSARQKLFSETENQITYELGKLGEKFTGLKETIDSTLSNQSTIQSAFDKIREGTSLTSDEVMKLTNLYPELLGKFTKTADGWTIGTNELVKVNKSITESARTAIEDEKNLLQVKIDKLRERINFESIESLNPDLSKIQELVEELDNAEQEMSAWDNLLKMLSLDSDDLSSKIENFSKATSSLSSKMKTISSAFKEQNENGSLTVDTMLSLIDNGYAAALVYDDITGAVTINRDAYLQLAQAELAEQEAKLTAEKAEQEIKYRVAMTQASLEQKYGSEEAAQAYLDEASAINETINSIDNLIVSVQKLMGDMPNVLDGLYGGSGGGKTEDAVKKNFESFMKEYDKLHERGLISDKEYYNKLEEANELYYKNCADHLDDYISNETKIYNARKEKYKSDTKEMIDNLKDQYDAGKIALEDYAKVLFDLSSSRYGEGSTYFGTEFATDALKENFKDAFDTITDAAKDSLSKMLITPDKYLDLINEWGKKLEITDGVLEKAKEVLSESDYLDAWDLANGYDSKNNKDYELRAKRVAYIYELAEKLYGKDGQNNVKAYNALIKQGLEEEKSIWEDRVNDEKSFWEDRQEEIETYYDIQIDKIKDVQEEENKLKDLEEKRLALIKARQNLENAKNQRNQLIFEGGTFRYDVDQDAILSAEEELADAIEALRDEELNTQIELLEEQKNNAVEFYKNIIDKIDEYLNKEDKILNSDSDVLNTILESDAPKANFDMQKFIDGGSNFESLVNALGGKFTQKAADYFKDSYNATLVGKQITPSTIDKVVNNSNSTTNNSSKSVNVGDIHIHLELTVKSLEDFVDNKIDETMTKLGNAIQQKMPAIWAKA